MIPGAPWHHCTRILSVACSPSALALRGGQFASPSSTNGGAFEDDVGRAAHERPTDASSRDSGRAPGRFRRDRARGRDSAIRVPVEPLRPLPVGIATRENGIRALVPRLAPPRVLCPVEHVPRGDERSRRAPHELVGLVRRRSPGRAGGARRRSAGSVRHETQQAGGSPTRPSGARTRARLGQVGIPAMKSGFARVPLERARARPRRGRASSLRGRGRRRSSSAQRTPAAPQYRSFSGLVARQRSQSSARQRSFGPRSAASVSSTISRMPARIRSSSQGSSVSGSKSSGR